MTLNMNITSKQETTLSAKDGSAARAGTPAKAGVTAEAGTSPVTPGRGEGSGMAGGAECCGGCGSFAPAGTREDLPAPARSGDPEGGAPGSESPREAGFDRRGTGHGMLEADRVASRWTVALRHVIVKLLNLLPGCHLKSRLLSRLLGIRMGENVGIAYGCYLDPYAPSMISFGENVLVGFETRIFVHAFTLTRQRVRPVTIGSNVMIGGFCVIAPGVTIGDNASIAPGSIVSRDVPPGALVVGNQVRIRKRGE